MPGDPDQASSWTSNPRRIAERWARGFDQPIREAFGRATLGKPATSSPIAMAIKSVALTAFQPAARAGAHHRLVVVSDMLEHTGCFSSYRDPLDFEQIRSRPCFAGLRPDLRGVTLEIWQVERMTRQPVQGRELVHFWEDLVATAGGALTRWHRL